MKLPRSDNSFELISAFEPSWDQPQAINQIIEWFDTWESCVTLLWATGTGKTFTMANIIKKYNKPTLILSHNKTLAAQLATEFKHFFPNNAVHYFVSYFDYYQPESYLSDRDIYIEKEATVNSEIEMFRLSTMASLLTRNDVIVVSSVSALYGLWSKEEYAAHTAVFQVWQRYNFRELKRQLIQMQYEPVSQKIEPWMFDMRGEMVDIYSSIDKIIYRLIFNEDYLEAIDQKNAESYESLWHVERAIIWPSSQYMQNMDDLESILVRIKDEMDDRVKEYESQGRILEAQRIKKRVMYDIRMIKETGFVNWIENYGPYFDKRMPGETPNTIFDFFPDDMLVIVDESHMSIPQLASMPNADKTRKTSLIEHWFRLPSAVDHRPLAFEEVQTILRWNRNEWDNSNSSKSTGVETISHSNILLKHIWLESKIKSKSKTMFVSATPATYEFEHSKIIAEQVIRPTWLLDPVTYIYPTSWDYELLMKNFSNVMKKKPFLEKYLTSYDHTQLTEIFDDQAEGFDSVSSDT